MSKTYYCDLCDTDFFSKGHFQRHVECCKFFFQTRTNECNKTPPPVTDIIPNNRMLYECLKDCVERLNRLEKVQEENLELRKIIKKRERQKIDTLDYLKLRYPIVVTDFSSMVAGPLKDVQQKHLEAVFAGTIIDGVVALVSDLIDSCKDTFPICAFSHKPHTLYVYDHQTWSEMPLDDINDLFDLLSNRFLGTYSRWEQKRLEFMVETEEVKIQKMGFMKRILGTYISDDSKYQKFKSFLFNRLKQNVKNIVEYEFV